VGSKCMIAAGFAGWLVLTSVSVVEGQAPPSSIPEHAAKRLDELRTRAQPGSEPQELLIRNLSRYWVRYLLPSGREELGRVLGTAERMTARAAAGLYGTLQTAAVQAGGSSIQPDLVNGLIGHVFPVEATGYGELAFFPDEAESGRLLLESVDLAVFSDTGLAWQVLTALDEAALAGDQVIPLEPSAIDAFQQGINTYALLLLRLAGLHAKRDLDAHVQSRHLREAGKTLAAATAEGLIPVAAQTIADPSFRETTEESGFSFRHVTSDWLAAYRRYGPMAPSFSGGGIAAADFDGDGWEDLVVCGGNGCSAFSNRHDGTFEDVTQASGVAIAGEARMPVLADLDNDGDRDLFITYARETNRLLVNDGSGRFSDLTTASGLERFGDISGPAVAVDVDGDALLDLYVGNFGDYLGGQTPWVRGGATNGMPNRLYRNLGGLKFEDVSDASGIGDTGWSQALSHCDFDRDGDQDLYIANDFGHNELLLNDGDGLFERKGEESHSDDEFHGMNVSFADLNRDRRADILVTNIWFWSALEQKTTETNSLLVSAAGPGPGWQRWEDPEFLRHDTGWSWGAHFFDYDNDGADDLFIANGFTDYLTFVQKRPHPDNPDQLYPINNSREPNWLLRRSGDMQFTPVASSLALDGVNSRGVVLVDFDHDGDLDVAISTFHSTARLFRNDAPASDSRWLVVELEGDPAKGVNRDAIGAQVVATNAEGFYSWRAVTGGEGYLSLQSPSVEFGLGSAEAVDLEILWPSGELQTITSVAGNQRVRIVQGDEPVELARAPLLE